MQTQQQQSSYQVKTKSATFLFSVCFGVAFGVFAIVVNLFYTFWFSPGTIALAWGAMLLAAIAAYLWPAILSSRRTGKVSSGLLAGTLSACISFLIGYLFNVYLAYTVTSQMRQNVETVLHWLQSLVSVSDPVHYSNTQVIQDAVNSIGAIAIIAVIGLCLGAFGGWIGRRSFRQQQTAKG